MPSFRHPDSHYVRIKHLSALLDAKIKFVVHGDDALNMIYRTPKSYACVPIPQHILVPDDAIGDAAHVLSTAHGYTIFNNPPFPTKLTDSIYAFRPSTALLDGNSATAMLYHPDPKYKSARCIFLHPTSTFQFDLDDPSTTLTNPHPPDPSLAAILFPTEIAFLDSLVDIIFERPVSVPGTVAPCQSWLFKMFQYGLSKVPNEWEASFLDDVQDIDEEFCVTGDGYEFSEPEWEGGTRSWNGKEISVLEYVSLAVKEENRDYLMTTINPLATPAPTISRYETVRIRAEIKAKRMKNLKLDVA